MRKDDIFREECLKQAGLLKTNLEINGWDGAWYRRAYFDDCTPLGSSTNEECKIDSIAQSWAVLAGVAGRDRAKMALDAADASFASLKADLGHLAPVEK